MKIDEAMRFPHPVLWSQTDDYGEGKFAVSVQIEEIPETGSVKASCTVALSAPDIQALLVTDRARIGMFVTCLETYYNKLLRLPTAGGAVEIPPGLLRGRVTFRPMIWSAEALPAFSSASVHPEFGAGPFAFDMASVLAIGEVTIINVGSDKLAPMGSIFDLAESADVAEQQFRVQPDDEKIQILASGKTLRKMHLLRNTPDGRTLLLNCVYLPVVMQILAVLRDGDGIYEGRRWCKVFRAKLDHLNIDVKTAELLPAAQVLLKSPFGRLNTDTEVAPS